MKSFEIKTKIHFDDNALESLAQYHTNAYWLLLTLSLQRDP